MSIAHRHDLEVIEDAAQAVMASYKGRALGSIADLGAFSFHETKNVISGEGGSLLVNRPDLVARAEIVREKGTDRSRFFRGQVDKYTWQEAGSSFLPGEIIAAFLWAQLAEAARITEARLASWHVYHSMLDTLEAKGGVRRPIVPEGCRHNAHMYYVLLRPGVSRAEALERFRRNDIWPVFHYVPLHSSPAGRLHGRAHGRFEVTDSIAARLLRLPLWVGITEAEQAQVVRVLGDVVS